jgi:hypothetical protein
MNLTVALTGMLPAIVLISAALTAAVSVVLLWLYRRAVLRSMAARAVSAPPPPSRLPPGLPRAPRPPPLEVVSVASGPAATPGANSAYDRATRSLRRAAWVYIAGGLAYALVLSAPWMVVVEGGFALTRLLFMTVAYGWPTVLALGLLAATSRGQWLAILGGYFALLAAVGAYSVARNAELTVGQVALFWLVANGAETVLLLAFLNRRVRAVGPLVLAFMLVGVTGAFLLVNLAGASNAFLRAIVEVGSVLELDALGTLVLMHLMGFAVFSLVGWWLLRRIGRRYEAKRTSDQQLTLDALWLLFGVGQSISLVFEGWAWIFTGLAGFAAYKLVTVAGFALLAARHPPPPRAPMLLLLRVFALGRRSERLFDVLAKRWLRGGSIGLIAGPDLVTTAVEPHEFLGFVGGRLARQFVAGEADLERRLSQLDTRPDPDGRYRVNEFFCHADTWQLTMRRLARASAIVLMDLRSFSRTNQGCVYELGELLAAVPLDRVVFVVDASTDRPFLQQTLQELWQSIPPGSPNLALASPRARLFEVRKQSAGMTRALLALLFGGGDAPAGEAVRDKPPRAKAAAGR